MTARRPRAHLYRYRLDAAVGLTPDERADRGKAARAAVPRESHAAFDPPAGRPDLFSLLEEQTSSRVPELVPIRYGRMLEDPFSYFRGAAPPMASDLAYTRLPAWRCRHAATRT